MHCEFQRPDTTEFDLIEVVRPTPGLLSNVKIKDELDLFSSLKRVCLGFILINDNQASMLEMLYQ